MDQPKRLHPAITAIIVVVLVGIVTSAVIIINAPAGNNESVNSAEGSSQVDTADVTGTDAYEDGTYSAKGFYSTPAGRESIDLTVTLANGIITSTSIVQNATDGEADFYQTEFNENYKSLVVGKNVDQVSLSRVAGSSLTSNGFNQALKQIREDAAA